MIESSIICGLCCFHPEVLTRITTNNMFSTVSSRISLLMDYDQHMIECVCSQEETVSFAGVFDDEYYRIWHECESFEPHFSLVKTVNIPKSESEADATCESADATIESDAVNTVSCCESVARFSNHTSLHESLPLDVRKMRCAVKSPALQLIISNLHNYPVSFLYFPLSL